MSKPLELWKSRIYSHLESVASIVLTDDAGIITDVDVKFCRMVGLEYHELIGTNIYDYVVSDNLKPLHCFERKEVQFKSRSGFVFWLELSSFKLAPDREQEQIHFLWFGIDITERKSVENFLADSQLFSKTLMLSAPVGIFVTNQIGGCIYVNNQWCNQSGMSASKARSDGWQSRLHPQDKSALIEDWNALIRTQNPFKNRQFRYLHTDGKEVSIYSSAVTLYDIKSNISGYIRIEQDITARIENEKTIQNQQAKLASSSKLSSLGEMAGGIAHEINTPLASIKSLSSQIQELTKESPVELELIISTATTIEKTTDRIGRIVAGLRSFSRDGGRDPFQSVNISDLIDETLSFCLERFKHHDIKVDFEKCRNDLSIEARATQLSQVLLNLLNNAHDAISSVSEKWIKINVIETSDHVEIQVTDSGHGVPESVREKIFQPFFTTKAIGHGTGMGLSISSGIIQSHNGELTIDPKCPNTRFRILLPKKQPPKKVA